MKSIQRLFGWLVIIGPIHMVEQLLFGIDEIYEIKRLLAAYHGWFRNPDYGTVLLATIAGTLILLISYGLLVGGRWRLLAVGFFGVLGVTEGHHIVRVVIKGTYVPGAVTAIPFMVVSVLILRAVVRQSRNRSRKSENDHA